ncbi:MAG: hypothetical protein WBB73_12920 [Candidatus Aminicenantaceae bacterium]
MTDEQKTKTLLLEDLSILRQKLEAQEELRDERDQLIIELELRERRFRSVVENIDIDSIDGTSFLVTF